MGCFDFTQVGDLRGSFMARAFTGGIRLQDGGAFWFYIAIGVRYNYPSRRARD